MHAMTTTYMLQACPSRVADSGTYRYKLAIADSLKSALAPGHQRYHRRDALFNNWDRASHGIDSRHAACAGNCRVYCNMCYGVVGRAGGTLAST